MMTLANDYIKAPGRVYLNRYKVVIHGGRKRVTVIDLKTSDEIYNGVYRCEIMSSSIKYNNLENNECDEMVLKLLFMQPHGGTKSKYVELKCECNERQNIYYNERVI